MQEGGTNTLFLAAGFLHWKKTEADTLGLGNAARAPSARRPPCISAIRSSMTHRITLWASRGVL